MKTMSYMPPIPQDVYTPEDKAEYERLSKDGVLTLFIYSKTYYFGGERIQFDESNYKVRTELRKGNTVVPVDAFGVFGIDYSEALKIDDFSIKPFENKGKIFVPAVEFAKKLGLSVILAYKDRVTVIGSEEKITEINNAFKKSENMGVAAADLVIGKYDPYKFTSADYKMARDKWRKALVSCPEDIDLNNEDIKRRLESNEKGIEDLLNSMNRGENIPILWGDAPPSESEDILFQFSKINSLAYGYGTYGTKFYHNEELREAIVFALEWMYANMYGEAELEGRGWRDINAYNWWHWYVGGPNQLTDALIIMGEAIPKEDQLRYMKLFKWLLENWRLEYNTDKSPSRVATGAKYAIIAEDPEKLEVAATDYHIMLETVVEGEGTRHDYCYYCHGIPYSLTYGFMLIDRVLKTAVNFAGTPLEYVSNRYYDQFMLVRYMFDAALYKGRGLKCFFGRGFTNPDTNKGYETVGDVIKMLGSYGAEEDEYLEGFIKRTLTFDHMKKGMLAGCPLSDYETLKRILEDENIPSENKEDYAYAWFNSDRAVQHKKNYAIAVAMPSYRHVSYESINHNNQTGWYTGDGTVYFYTETDPDEFAGENFILNPRLAQRMPGTTVDSRERDAVSISEGWIPDNDKVGCMDFEKKYIVAGMDYTSYHNEVFDESYYDMGHGGAKPKFINDLVAKKAYFMFEDECVCIGSGINSTMNSDILTTVEHRRLMKFEENPYGADKITVNGIETETELFSKDFKNPSYARVEGFAGYVFLDAENVSVSKYMHAYSKDYAELVCHEGYKPVASEEPRPFVEILINHGKNPTNGSYAYVMLPYATEEKTKAYAENPNVEILSNTNKIQAVKDKTLCITGIIFYEAGECAGIKVDKPCIVTFKEKDGEFLIKVCEPTNKEDTLNVEILKPLSPISVHNRYDVIYGNATHLTLNTKESYGEGYEARFTVK